MADALSINSMFAVCYTPGFVGAVLSVFMLFPFVLWISVAIIHMFLRDVFALIEFFVSFTAVWTLALMLQQGIHESRPNRTTCAMLGLNGNYGMPDPWLVSTSIYLLTWVSVAAIYRAANMAYGLGMLFIAWLLYVASAKYNDYQSWAQLAVSLAMSAGITALCTLLIYFVYVPMFRAEAKRLARLGSSLLTDTYHSYVIRLSGQ